MALTEKGHENGVIVWTNVWYFLIQLAQFHSN